MNDSQGAVKALLMALGLFLCLFGFLVFISNSVEPYSLWPNSAGKGILILFIGIVVLVAVGFAFDYVKRSP
jgi:hypothetical protein